MFDNNTRRNDRDRDLNRGRSNRADRTMQLDKMDEAQFVKVRTKKTGFRHSERWRITRNVLVIGLAFMVNFTAFMGATNLQSSINADGSLGTFTLASIYGSLIFSNIFLPTLIIRWDFVDFPVSRICKMIKKSSWVFECRCFKRCDCRDRIFVLD